MSFFDGKNDGFTSEFCGGYEHSIQTNHDIFAGDTLW